jgi:hypothetical protein
MTDMTAEAAGLERRAGLERLPGKQPAIRAASALGGDAIFRIVIWGCGLLVLVLLGAIIAILFQGGLPALLAFGPAFLWNTAWNPVTMRYGAGVMIYGTLFTSVIAILIAVPMSLSSSLNSPRSASAGRSASPSSCSRPSPRSSTACGAFSSWSRSSPTSSSRR